VHDKQVRRRRAVLGVLVAASLILLTAYFGAPQSSPLHQVQRGIVEVLSPIQEGASKVLSPVRDIANWFSSTLRAKSQVEALKRRNQKLVYELALDQDDQQENAQLRGEVKLDQAPGLAGYTLVAANVYSEDPELFYQTISVYKGSDDGVRINDPVIGDQGLVGKVTTVDSTVSVVTLITSPSFEVGAEVQDAAGDKGTLEPETGDPNQMLLQYLPSGAQIAVGQLVVTSGFKFGALTSLYPAGIPIGTVSDANSNTLINDQQVQVTPLVDLRHLTTVQILTHAGGSTARAQVPTKTAQVTTPSTGTGSG
jgi:rod shape-determining protein MreC